MPSITAVRRGTVRLLQGNEAIARGALEAGVRVAAGYPGTPSSEIIESLARAAGEGQLYVEWSVNEKVAMEVAAAASFAELRAMCVMKQVGVNVAADFLLHVAQYGTRGGMVLVSCEDPGALSSTNEGDSRQYARMMEFPLLEPADFQECQDLTRWAFELSEELRTLVMVRSVTRLSHASGNVTLGDLPAARSSGAGFRFEGTLLGQMQGPIATLPSTLSFIHQRQQQKLKKAAELFEASPFNRYDGPDDPELLVITASTGWLYCREAIHLLGVSGRVGLLKIGTTWPLPPRLLGKHLAAAERVLVVEELLPFLEDGVMVLAAELGRTIGPKTFHGKKDGTLPPVGELNPDRVAAGISKILGPAPPAVPVWYGEGVSAVVDRLPQRDLTFCAGCPHRASFWAIHHALALDARRGFVCGDIGCYSMAIGSTGYGTLKTLHSMGSGLGLAAGFGKLGPFGMDQPAVAVCGDSTFFHAVLPALVNAVHHRSPAILVVLDNSGTGMTGFQPHPGSAMDAMGRPAAALDVAAVCKGMGAEVRASDPFDIAATQQALLDYLEQPDGLRVLILKQSCALSPEKKGKKAYEVSVDPDACLGDACGCNRLCTRVFGCPGLVWDSGRRKARVDEVICAGCGVCASICPAGAIRKKEAF
jgi:indolepyruvate ferredoxin oxidoreductase alpha subunit